jgi:membrane carboxypeptidase/penicillin-binding protein PbpC
LVCIATCSGILFQAKTPRLCPFATFPGRLFRTWNSNGTDLSREMNRIFIPRQLDGSPGEAVFELAHRNPQTEVYWFIDEEFSGTTVNYHQFSLIPSPGWHTLTVTDQNGNQLQKRFLVVLGE